MWKILGILYPKIFHIRVPMSVDEFYGHDSLPFELPKSTSWVEFYGQLPKKKTALLLHQSELPINKTS